MSVESTATLGGPGVPSSDALPALTAVSVADDHDVEPLLRRAAADLSALKLRLGAATRRADAADARALVDEPTDLAVLEAETTEAVDRLRDEEAEHRRRLDAELVRVRAEAAELIDTARADAAEIVRAASLELPTPVEPPVEAEVEVEVEAPVEDPEAPPVVVAAPGPSFAARLVHPDAVLLVLIAFVVILLVSLG
jgi:hypothetical protein